MASIGKGVIVEFDFTVLNGAELLFGVAKSVLKDVGVELTEKLEGMHLSGGNYHGALIELFGKTGCGASAGAVAADLNRAFAETVSEKAPQAVTVAFKNFVKTLLDKGVKVVVATRGDVAALAAAIGDDRVAMQQETSATYGCCKWDVWKRECRQNSLHESLAVAVAGSGFGVKAAMIAGLGVLGVQNSRVAWQDFGGADYVVDGLDKSAADCVLKMLKVS